MYICAFVSSNIFIISNCILQNRFTLCSFNSYRSEKPDVFYILTFYTLYLRMIVNFFTVKHEAPKSIVY